MDFCAVCIGDHADEDNELTGHGTIATSMADWIQDPTHAGINRISVGTGPAGLFEASRTSVTLEEWYLP